MRKTIASNALATQEKRIVHNPELAKRFKQAENKKASIQDFIDEFMGNHVSEDTKRAYMKDLQYFFEFLRSGGVSILHPSEIRAHHFQLYRDVMIEQKYAPATINRRLIAIRSFVKWSIAAKLMDHNPLDMVKLPKVQTVAPTVAFDDQEVVNMLSVPDTSSHRGRMHRLAMVFLFQLGLRRAELINLKMKDIFEDRGHRVLRIHGKGDKTRLVPLTDFVIDEIDTYLKELEKYSGMVLEFEDYILQTDGRYKNQIPVDGSTIYRIINRAARDLGIEKRVSPHSCRATVISHLLDTQHTPIRDVATFAGHVNITTTERYDKRRENLDKSAAYAVNYFLIKEG